MADSLIGRKELGRLLDCSGKTIYKMQELDDDFPQPIKIGPSQKWVRSEVDQYIETKKAERDGGYRTIASV